MLKLKKRAACAWAGNGMGTSAAAWVVEGREQYRIVEHRPKWWKAYNDAEGPVVVVPYAETRAACVALLAGLIDQS